jgi:hypothetical protein
MRVAGIDYSSRFVDVVTVPYEGAGAPVWHRFPLVGADAFDRARSVADSVPGRSSVLWDDVLAVGIEHPGGNHGTGALLRVQGAILARIPARMLVHPLPPGKWRKLVGIKGNATKTEAANRSINEPLPSRYVIDWGRWPQDAHDAHLIALATRSLIDTKQAA